jgi:hypothetical protein
MTESGSSSPSGSEELDDPGRDPKGLNPPRNPFGAGPDQDSGRGEPKGSPGIAGESMVPESPQETENTRDQ